VAQVAVCSQTSTKIINTVWAERTVVKIFNLLVHPVTSMLLNIKQLTLSDKLKSDIEFSEHY
jgi:hypothetical protein